MCKRIERICQVDPEGWYAPVIGQELVRCKECKWCRTFYHGETMPFSYECAKLWLTNIGVDDFCSRGERKEG